MGISHTTTSNGQSTATDLHQLLDRVAAQAGLHEVPVAEEHRVGDRTEERRADDEAGQAQRVGRRRRTWRRRAARHADDRRDEVEPRVESPSAASVASPACRSSRHPANAIDARAATTGARRTYAQRPAASHRRCPRAIAAPVPVSPARRRRADRHHAVRDAQQPAVADADLAPARGDPAEQQAAGGPLQQQRGEVERHRMGPESADDREVACGAVQAVGSVVGGDHDVLEAEPEAAGQVDAGLDAEGVARRRGGVRVARDDVRVLVLLDADAVAGAVDELARRSRRRR